jgi:hypothetical protein
VILFELEESPVRSILRNRSSSHREFLLAPIHPASGRFIQYFRYKFEKKLYRGGPTADVEGWGIDVEARGPA